MSNNRKNKKEKRTAAIRIRNIMLIVILTFSVTAIVGGLSFCIYVAAVTESEIDETLFELLNGNTASEIYYYESESDREAGIATKLEGQELYGGYRSIPISYSELPNELIYAFISIEDRRFFSHSGVDWKRTVGAAANYIFRFDDEFGGSTITQQLIKNVTERDEYSLERKLQEIMWALDLETKMSKEEILQNYLNIINLSNGCYGVGAAADYYFSKSVDELTLIESASIAAITNNPSYYDPIRNPENNRDRAELILWQMNEQGYISDEEYLEGLGQNIELKVRKGESSRVNLWYVDMVIEDVICDLEAEYGYSRSMANLMLYRGGLKIYTAMDYTVQTLIEDYYADKSNFPSADGNEAPQSAMIIIDPYSGDILGVVGAIGKKSANRLQNFATDTLRPAGSVVKPLSVYAPALEKGIINWASVYDDTPVNFGPEDSPQAWPRNANNIYRGLTNVNYAISHSINTVTVKVLEDLGLETSFNFLYDSLSIKSLIEEKKLDDGRVLSDVDYAALALGQFNYGVTVREITAAYSIFVNQGIYNETRSYYRVSDRAGNTLLEKKYSGRAVISENNAIIMTKMLQNVVSDGTASNIKLKNQIDCAGKTGTTQNNYDKWYIGYTPYFIGGVWYGYEYPKELSYNFGNACIEVWDEVMTLLHRRYISDGNIKSFDESESVIKYEYCRDSGCIVTAACKKDARGNRSETGYFEKGSEPTKKCYCHVLVAYDTAEGGIATDDCYSADVKYVGMISVERSFPIQIYVSDAQYVYKELPRDIIPETSLSLPYFNNLLSEGEYCGISYGNTQFNRYCRAHFDYWKWKNGRDNE